MVHRLRLTQGKVALVDDADWPAVKGHRWHAVRVGNHTYAARKLGPRGAQKTIYLHRVVSKGALIHHENASGLDDRKANLSATSQSGNQRGVKHRRKRKAPG